jgi:hypothetical protein
MPGKEIKGRSKIASYRHGGRTGFKEGSKTGTFLTFPAEIVGETIKIIKKPFKKKGKK